MIIQKKKSFTIVSGLFFSDELTAASWHHICASILLILLNYFLLDIPRYFSTDISVYMETIIKKKKYDIRNA